MLWKVFWEGCLCLQDDTTQDKARGSCSCTTEGVRGHSSSLWQDQEDGCPWCSQVSFTLCFCFGIWFFNLLWMLKWWMKFIRVLRLQKGHKYCHLGQLSSEVGWNYYDTIRVSACFLEFVYSLEFHFFLSELLREMSQWICLLLCYCCWISPLLFAISNFWLLCC